MALLRWSALRERLRTSLWLWPAVAVTAAVVAGTVLPVFESGDGGSGLVLAGTPDGARALLATVAGSMITVTGLTFSLTVVALQVASTQFTPRLLSTFLSDRGNQAVLSVFLGTFAYSLAVLPSVQNASERTAAFVPDLAVGVGLALTLLSVGMLVYFLHHLTSQLRVESVLGEVQRDTLAMIRARIPGRDDGSPPPAPDVPQDAVALRALRTGHLQAVDAGAIAGAAAAHDCVVALRPSVGAHVTEGTTLAWAWPSPRPSGEGPDVEALTAAVHDGIHLGTERTLPDDVAFGVRQIVDIIARALSPGVNDPTTAVTAMGPLATVLVELAQRRLGPIVVADDDGRVRAVVSQPTFSEVLALACDQPRRYGRQEPAVLTELLRMLTDLAEVARDDDARRAIGVQIDATMAAVDEEGLDGTGRARVRTFVRHARAALEHGERVPSVPSEVEEPAS